MQREMRTDPVRGRAEAPDCGWRFKDFGVTAKDSQECSDHDLIPRQLLPLIGRGRDEGRGQHTAMGGATGHLQHHVFLEVPNWERPAETEQRQPITAQNTAAI